MLVFKARPRRDPAQRPILTPSEKRVMQIMARARKEVIDNIKSREGDFLNSLLHQPAISTARMVITQPWFDVQEELQQELTTEVIDGGRRIKLDPIQKATVNFRFNAERPEAAAWAAKNAGQMIQNITEDQLNFVQELVRQSELGEYTPDSAARTLRDMENGVGLTVQQSQWVQNFESRRITDLMDQGLGYVDAVSRAQGPTARYADRIYRYRTETIARTEILRASNEGRNQAWKQGLDEGFINPSQEKEWSTNLDDRTCEECAPLDGERVGVTEDFPWGDPPIHPNCRCTVLLTDDIPEDLADMTVDELEAEINRLLDERENIPARSVGIEIMPDGLTREEQAAWIKDRVDSTYFDRRGDAGTQEAYDSYTGMAYQNYNDALRFGTDVDRYRDRITTLRDGIMSAEPVKADLRVWRGVRNKGEFGERLLNAPVGERITDAAFVSTSVSKEVGFEFGGRRGIVLEIDVPQGSRAVMGASTQEAEIILPPSSTIEVVSRRVEMFDRVERVVLECRLVT